MVYLSWKKCHLHSIKQHGWRADASVIIWLNIPALTLDLLESGLRLQSRQCRAKYLEGLTLGRDCALSPHHLRKHRSVCSS